MTALVGESVGTGADNQRSRLFASETRIAILRHLWAARDGLTTSDIATTLRLHASTVRTHLERLAEAGLLVKAKGDGRGRGRPAWLYRCASPAPATGMYGSLAAARLRRVVDEAGGGAEAACVGERWGRRLATGVVGAPPVDAVVQVLDRLGFVPRLVDRSRPADGLVEVHLLVCPFTELVVEDPTAMCALHLGLIRGVLAAAGSPAADAAVLDPFGAPTACVMWLPAARPATDRRTRSAGGRRVRPGPSAI